MDGRERTAGALFGLAAGDALGAPVEFLSAAEIARSFGRVTEMMDGGPWLAGEWTDDTALALAAAEAYGGEALDLDRAANAMVDWLRGGPKDVGNLTRIALTLIAHGEENAATAGARAMEGRPSSAGNGSLMRAAPTGIARRPDDPRIDEESQALSRITHADRRCVAACIAFNAALSELIEGSDVDRALAAARDAIVRSGGPEEVRSLVQAVIDREPLRYASAAIGYVLLCLERSLVALRDATSFEEGVVDVVNEGGDADTNGAVTGALLGARFGLGAIPKRWLDALRSKDPIQRAVERLAAVRGLT